jgi:hypothetical protein
MMVSPTPASPSFVKISTKEFERDTNIQATATSE